MHTLGYIFSKVSIRLLSKFVSKIFKVCSLDIVMDNRTVAILIEGDSFVSWNRQGMQLWHPRSFEPATV